MEKTAKELMIAAIRKHGANGTILALAKALADLDPEWRRVATGIEAVAKHSPHRRDDWRSSARCGECASCQEFVLTPKQAGACSRRYANGHA